MLQLLACIRVVPVEESARWCVCRQTYSKELKPRFSVVRTLKLLTAAGNVPVSELLAKLMDCSTQQTTCLQHNLLAQPTICKLLSSIASWHVQQTNNKQNDG